MEEVLVLHPERNGSSDNSCKTYVVHVVLPIAVTYHGVEEPTPKTSFFIQQQQQQQQQKDFLRFKSCLF